MFVPRAKLLWGKVSHLFAAKCLSPMQARFAAGTPPFSSFFLSCHTSFFLFKSIFPPTFFFFQRGLASSGIDCPILSKFSSTSYDFFPLRLACARSFSAFFQEYFPPPLFEEILVSVPLIVPAWLSLKPTSFTFIPYIWDISFSTMKALGFCPLSKGLFFLR